MERLDVEVQYRTAKWIFTNMMFAGEITLEEYTEIHKKLIERFDPPMKLVEAPGFYVQEVFDIRKIEPMIFAMRFLKPPHAPNRSPPNNIPTAKTISTTEACKVLPSK